MLSTLDQRLVSRSLSSDVCAGTHQFEPTRQLTNGAQVGRLVTDTTAVTTGSSSAECAVRYNDWVFYLGHCGSIGAIHCGASTSYTFRVLRGEELMRRKSLFIEWVADAIHSGGSVVCQ
jgi:hypothetical protein